MTCALLSPFHCAAWQLRLGKRCAFPRGRGRGGGGAAREGKVQTCSRQRKAQAVWIPRRWLNAYI
jgi:hypothetical protein